MNKAELIEAIEARMASNNAANARNPYDASAFTENDGLTYALALIRKLDGRDAAKAPSEGVEEKRVKSLIREQLPSFGSGINSLADVGNAKYAADVADGIFDALRPFLRSIPAPDALVDLHDAAHCAAHFAPGMAVVGLNDAIEIVKQHFGGKP